MELSIIAVAGRVCVLAMIGNAKTRPSYEGRATHDNEGPPASCYQQ